MEENAAVFLVHQSGPGRESGPGGGVRGEAQVRRSSREDALERSCPRHGFPAGDRFRCERAAGEAELLVKVGREEHSPGEIVYRFGAPGCLIGDDRFRRYLRKGRILPI